MVVQSCSFLTYEVLIFFFNFLFITTEKCVVEFRDFNISYCF